MYNVSSFHRRGGYYPPAVRTLSVVFMSCLHKRYNNAVGNALRGVPPSCDEHCGGSELFAL